MSEKNYILIPVYDKEIKLESKEISGSRLTSQYSEDIIDRALNKGETLIYKGNEYFLDEAL